MGLDLGIHDLICLILFISHGNPRFLLKHIQSFGIDIFSPVINDQFFPGGISRVFQAVSDPASDEDNEKDCGNRQLEYPFPAFP